MNWTRPTSIALLGLIFLGASSSIAQADPDPSAETQYVPKIIPECNVYTLSDGREVCGWLTIVEVTAAYKADAELVRLRATSAAQADQITAFGIQVASITAALEAERRSLSVVQARETKLTADLIAMNKKYEYERVRPRWGNPIAWTSAAGLAAILLGIIGKELLD